MIDIENKILLKGAAKKSRRQKLLLEQIMNTGYVSVEEVFKRFEITPQTARRDMADLLETGKVRRCHGGMAPAVPFDAVTRSIRRGQNLGAKRRIAEKIATLIPDKSSVYLDVGSTLESVARALLHHRVGLSISTNSARIALDMSEREDFVVHIPAGIVRAGDNSIMSPSIVDWLDNQHFDFAILTCGGIAQDGMITVDTPLEIPILQAAIAAAQELILAVDATKIDFSAPEKLMDLEGVSFLVSDASLNAAFKAMLSKKSIQYLTV